VPAVLALIAVVVIFDTFGKRFDTVQLSEQLLDIIVDQIEFRAKGRQLRAERLLDVFCLFRWACSRSISS
jgi:hypothetical protein